MGIIKDRDLGLREAADLRERFPWWSAAHIVASEQGAPTKESYLLPARGRLRRLPATSLLKEVRAEEFQRSEMLGIIDAFIHSGDHHKIVIDEATTEESLAKVNEPGEQEDVDEEEFLSEELAEIYAKQHLFDQAIEIYQKLSLQIPQKSIYFAELIEQLNAQKRLTEK